MQMRSEWRTWLVLAALAMPMLGCSWLQSTWPRHGAQSQEAADANSKAQNTPLSVRILSVPEEVVKTDWSNPHCTEPQSHNEADLCQQRDMAETANRAFWATVVQSILGIVAAGLLVWQLILTRRAVWAANETARITRNSERPFINVRILSVEETHIETARDGPHHILVVNWRASNQGKSIALLDTCAIKFTVCDRKALPSSGFSDTWEKPLGGMCAAPSDDPIEDSINIDPVSEAEWAAANTLGQRMVIYGYVRYRDMHDVMRRRGFAFDYRPSVGEDAPPDAIRSGGFNYDREETAQERAEPEAKA